MKISSAPRYFSFLSQTENPFFDKIWSEQLSALSSDLNWIDELEKQDNEIYSRDPHHEDFPTFWNWPQKWQSAYDKAKELYETKTAEHLLNAIKYKFEEVTVYVLEDEEEVWLSTPHYNHGSTEKMGAVEKYDSAITAAYIYINEYNDWRKKHKANWYAANILSSVNPKPPTDYVICEMCGQSFDIAQNDTIEICTECRS